MPTTARHRLAALRPMLGLAVLVIAILSVLNISCTRKVAAGNATSQASRLKIYDEIVAEAQRCAGDEKCAIAGGVKGCRCPVAVRASAKQRVDEAARQASCEQVERLYCPPLENPRCEKQVCVADQVRE